jgi:hypothetical protein
LDKSHSLTIFEKPPMLSTQLCRYWSIYNKEWCLVVIPTTKKRTKNKKMTIITTTKEIYNKLLYHVLPTIE